MENKYGKNKNKEIEVFGEKFESVKEAANHYGIRVNLIYSRMHKGLTLEESINLGNKVKEEIKIDGEIYKNISEVAKKFNIRASELVGYTKRYATIGEAIKEILLKKESKKITVNGRVFNSLSEVSTYFGVNYVTLRYRLKDNWEIEKAINTPVNTNLSKNRKIEFRGEIYKSKSDILLSLGLGRTIVTNISNKYKIPWEESLGLVYDVIDKYKDGRPKIINKLPYAIYDNIWFFNLEEFINYINVDLYSFYSIKERNKLGYSETIKKMKAEQKVTWLDLQTNAVEDSSIIETKYKQRIKTLEKIGKVKKILVTKFPEISYDENIKIHEPIKELQKNVNEYLNKKKKKK